MDETERPKPPRRRKPSAGADAPTPDTTADAPKPRARRAIAGPDAAAPRPRARKPVPPAQPQAAAQPASVQAPAAQAPTPVTPEMVPSFARKPVPAPRAPATARPADTSTRSLRVIDWLLGYLPPQHHARVREYLVLMRMDGDVAPLRGLAALCSRQRATLMVDDAHGLGVLGPGGAGSVAEAGLSQDEVPVLMGTLGKALGVAGAFVAGSAALVDGLVQQARTFVYTTALPPALAAATCTAIDIARFEEWRRERLLRLVAHFRQGATARGIRLLDSRTPIQPILVGDAAAALALSQRLEANGFYVPAIRPPTVPQGAARLRVALSALHAESDLERLLDALAPRATPSSPELPFAGRAE